jgi:DNA-binding transcriptional MocR family regulator
MSFHDKLQQIQKNRARSKPPLPGGSAPYTISSDFKLWPKDTRSKAVRWNHRLSLNCLLQKSSPFKSANRGSGINAISLGTARPAPEFYPWDEVVLKCGQSFSGDANSNSDRKVMACVRGEAEYSLDVALNYGSSIGSPQVLRYVTEHIEIIHDPQYDDWECCLTCGNTSALDIALRIFCNPGDAVLVEQYTYPMAQTTIGAQGLHTVAVEMDEFGLVPSDLNYKLETWDNTSPKPFVLYMIPTGQNPSGITQSADRRREIYEIAVKHDLFILEDDPYYFLQIDQTTHATGPPQPPSSRLDDYLSLLPPSYLSLDVSGRVLRMDSTSKMLAPGLRGGWITGCSQIIEKFVSYSEVGVLCPSGPTQVMLYKLLDQTWGHEGFIRWLESLSQRYGSRLDTMLRACDQHLPKGICTWRAPTAGMFLWIRIDATRHPIYNSAADEEHIACACSHIENRIFIRSQENGVIISKGSWFNAGGYYGDHSHAIYLRLTFAAAPAAVLASAVHAFAEAVLSEFDSQENRMES